DRDEHGASPVLEIVENPPGILGPATDDRQIANRAIHQPPRGEAEPGHDLKCFHAGRSRESRASNGAATGPFRFSKDLGKSVPLDANRDAHAATDAERGKALLRVALLHLVDERGEDARARGADRVANGDGAAVDVDLARVPAEFFPDRDRLRRKGLVRLDQVEIADRPAGLLQRLLRSWYRADAHDRGVDA